MYPGVQLQVYPFISSSHVAEFRQGNDAHSSTSVTKDSISDRTELLHTRSQSNVEIHSTERLVPSGDFNSRIRISQHSGGFLSEQEGRLGNGT